MIEQLPLDGLPLIAGGRSAGARVACRTAAETNADAVLCLAFPVHPPGKPEKTRLSELDAVTVPVLVVQGASDPFGMPPEAPDREVVTVAGQPQPREEPRRGRRRRRRLARPHARLGGSPMPGRSGAGERSPHATGS